MTGATVRGFKAGEEMGKAIVEMVHLMYQNNTAAHFYRGLSKIIKEEMKHRKIKENKTEDKPMKATNEFWKMLKKLWPLILITWVICSVLAWAFLTSFIL